MEIAALVVAIVAAVAAAGGTLYARESARSAKQSADAAARSAAVDEGSLAIKAARFHKERTPTLTAEISRLVGSKLCVQVSESDEPLTALQVTIGLGQGVSFKRGSSGVDPPDVGVEGYSDLSRSQGIKFGPRSAHDHSTWLFGHPFRSMDWDVEVDEVWHSRAIGLEATCYRGEESWHVRFAADVGQSPQELADELQRSSQQQQPHVNPDD